MGVLFRQHARFFFASLYGSIYVSDFVKVFITASRREEIL